MRPEIACLLAGTGVFLAVPALVNGETVRNAIAPAAVVSIMDYGADRNGQSDSTTAIKAAIEAARMRGEAVLVPSGTFIHRSFSLDGVSMSGAGTNSTLLAPNPGDSTIFLRGSGPALRNMTVEVKSSHRDATNPAITIDHAEQFSVDTVTVQGGNAGGIFNFGGVRGTILRNHVQDTLADAIHNTNGAHDILISGNTVRHAGDDMIAVVSYGNESISHDILIEHNDVADQENGRGISVVGGQDVTIQDNRIARTNCCAGIYLAAEGSWHTASVRNVLVRDNVLTANSGRTGHGAIMVFAGGGSVRDVRLEGNTIVDARHAAITLSGTVSNIAIIDNRIINPAEGAITGNATNVYCSGNSSDGSLVRADTCNAKNTITVTGSEITLDIGHGRDASPARYP